MNGSGTKYETAYFRTLGWLDSEIDAAELAGSAIWSAALMAARAYMTGAALDEVDEEGVRT